MNDLPEDLSILVPDNVSLSLVLMLSWQLLSAPVCTSFLVCQLLFLRERQSLSLHEH